MKTLFSLFVVAFLCVTSTFADDAAFVSKWKFPVAYWFPESMPLPTGGIDNIAHAQALADSIGDFDPVGAVFDDVWAGLTLQGAGYPIAKQNGNALSDKGASDFGNAAFKVVYDQYSIYILLQYHDDAIDGNEVVELMWAPYVSIPAIASLPTVVAITNKPVSQTAPYCRYSQFGGNKAAFTDTGYRDACIVDFDATGLGSLNVSGTNSVLKNNLGYVNKIELGSHTVKAIYTIGFQTLTGNAYATALNARPTFDHKTWRTLNNGKGITFDIKVADDDPDDQLNTAVPPVVKPGEYWWNTSSNDGWALSCYSGYLGIRGAQPTAVNSVYASKPAIFGKVTSTKVELTQNATIEVFNTIGERVISLNNTNKVDLSNFNKGVYIIRANNETLKFAR